MANYNRVILAGNLTRDPQLSYLPSNTPVVDFGLAINRRWRDQSGQDRDETCYIDCRCYGQQAETFNQYMGKGRSVLVEGRLQFQQWDGQDGTRRSKHVVIVERFQFLGAPRGEAGDAAAGARGRGAPRRAQPQAPPATGEPAADETPPDDIPF
jgi:single-strand DNA-binding protein